MRLGPGLVCTVLLFSVAQAVREDERAECAGFPNRTSAAVDRFLAAQTKFARTHTITSSAWERALLSVAERAQLDQLIRFLYAKASFADVNSSAVLEDFPLLNFLQVVFDEETSVSMIIEKETEDKLYPRHFGLVGIRSEAATKRFLHIGSPHFETDGAVSVQSTAVFDQSLAKSVVVSGAARDAIIGDPKTPCQRTAKCSDVAHNAVSNFHYITLILWNVSRTVGPSAGAANYFLQFHGMSEKSCLNSHAFLSVGAGGYHPVYNEANALVNKLRDAVNQHAPLSNFAKTPSLDTECKLVAANNVFGRVVNGVKIGDECSEKADEKNIKGHFIHIEQKVVSRCNTTLWSEALQSSVPARNSTSSNLSWASWLGTAVTFGLLCCLL